MGRHRSEELEDYEEGGRLEFEEFEKPSARKEKERSRKPRGDDDKYGDSRRRRHSDDDDSDDSAKGKQLVRRGKSKPDSEDDRKSKKSKSKDKKSKGKSKKRQDSDEDDSDEVIVTKTKKYEDVDIHDLPPPYLRALKKIFGSNDEKVEKWCHNSLIRLDKSTGLLNAEKLLKKQDDDDEIKQWAMYEKKYKRVMKEIEESSNSRGGPSIVVMDRGYESPPPGTLLSGYDIRCYGCRRRNYYCGHF